MVWRWLGAKPLSEPMMVSLVTYICITRPKWVNTLRPGAHFNNDFSIVIQILWKIYSVLTEVVLEWDGYAILHMTCQLCCRVHAKFCSNVIPYNGVTLKPIFHQIWIRMEKLVMKWAPGQNGPHLADNFFKHIFVNKSLYFTEAYFKGSNWQ